MLGLKIEDRHCLPNANATAAVPGIAFAEWGPGDMGMSHGDPDAHDPPYTPLMDHARDTVKVACDRAGIAFYSSWPDPTMNDEERVKFLIDEIGAKIVHGASQDAAETGRKLTGRTMPV